MRELTGRLRRLVNSSCEQHLSCEQQRSNQGALRKGQMLLYFSTRQYPIAGNAG